jgi:hypothetical protein
MLRPVFSSLRVGGAIVLLALAAGCSDAVSVCTELGCMSGLTIHLTSLPAAPFRIEVTVGGYPDILYSYDCMTGPRCDQDAWFPGLIADRVHVTVRVGTSSRSTDITPAYVHFRPNGPNCPPDCLSATISVIPPS